MTHDNDHSDQPAASVDVVMQDAGAVDAELAATKEALRKTSERLKDTETIKEGLIKQLEQEKKHKLKELLANAQEELKKKSDELKHCQGNLTHLTTQVERERARRANELQEWQRSFDQLNRHQSEADGKLKTVLDENHKLRAQCQISAESIREKDGELATLKSFLSNHNASSDADVQAALDRINDLTEDLATRTAETAREPARNPNQGNPADSYALVRRTIGDAMASMLHNASQKDDIAPVLLQFAWQTIILGEVDWVLGCFSAPHALLERCKEGERMLESLAGAVEREETQPTYGNWRSLTHRLLQSTVAPEDQEGCRQAVVDSVMRRSYAAAMVLLKRDCPSLRHFHQVFSPDVEEIMRRTFKFASMLKEEVVTKNFASVYPIPGDEFNNGVMLTEEGEAAPNDRVGCTTRLGLSYAFKPARENAAKQTKNFVQAQVVTASALKELVSVSPMEAIGGRLKTLFSQG